MRHSRLAFSLQAAGEDLGQIKHIQHLQCLKFTQVRGIQALLGELRLEYQDDNACARGAYELVAADGEAMVSLLATGSEVSIAVAARNNLQSAGIPARVVSMPCWELFEEQDEGYRRETLGQGTVRIGIEAAISMGWDRYVGENGGFIGMPGFGASAPAKDLYKHFGITAEAVVEMAKEKLAAQKG